MADQTYVFIDGAYLERVHREAMQAFFGEDGDLDIFPIGQQAQANRVYFYDSIDYTQSANENEADWRARVQRLEDSLDRIRLLPGFFVRTGTVPGRDKGKRREQKEVDVMLAVDMVKHALKANIKKAVLIGGDLDLRPAVEALVEEGVAVEVWYHASSFAQGLPGAADKGIELRFRQLHSWNTKSFRQKYRIPSEDRMHRASVRSGEVLSAGSIPDWDWPVELYRWYHGEQAKFQLWIHTGEWDSIIVRDDDLDLIKRYVDVQYAPVKWGIGEQEIREMQDRADAAGKR
jgi:uncharacterized LabA/DUF88 family protein